MSGRALLAALLIVALALSWSAGVTCAQPAAQVTRTTAVSTTPRFDHLSVSDGLSHKAVTAIMQDRRGFLWFGTQSGLNRYDGYEIRVYKYDPDDPNSISHNWIGGLLEDRDGSIWVGTFGGGLNRFDPVTETFTRYQHDPDDPGSLSHDLVGPLHQDAEGVLWIGTEGGGLNRFDPREGTFTHFKHEPDELTSLSDTTNAVRVILEDTQGRLWVGTWGGGLSLFDRKTEAFRQYSLPPSDAPHTVLDLYEDRRGTLWAGTEHAGLNRVDVDGGRLEPIPFSDPSLLADTPIASIYEDSRGVLWLGTWGKGLCALDRASGDLICHRHDARNAGSLSDDGVGLVYEDRSGVLWVGTWSGLSRLDARTLGVMRYRHDPNEPNSLSDSDIQTLYVDTHGTIWAGSWHGGLNRVDPASGRVRHYRYRAGDARSLSNDNVQAVLEGRDGVLWVGTWGGGLVRFEPRTDGFIRFANDPADSSSLHSNSILALLEDREGVLWLGTWDGLSRRDPATGKFHRVPASPEAAGGPGHVEIRVLFEDSRGDLWVGTRSHGLGRLDRKTGTLRFFVHDPDDESSLGHNTVWDIHEDRSGGLWVATGGGGLNRLDLTTERFTRFTAQQSLLPDNVIYRILEDATGRLWLGTERGLTRFEPSAARFTRYDGRPELRSCGFNSAGFHDRATGTIYVGCADGFAAFRPEQIIENTIPPAVQITDIRLFGRSVRDGSEATPGRPVSAAGEVVFDHDENDVSFQFVALHFADPAHNRYAYRLEGYDSDWRQAGTQRSATYTNLDPGTYVFHVRAANSDGVWNEQGDSVRLVIRPPWWRTWPAYLFYALLVAAALWAANRIERRRFVRKEREAARIMENALRAEAAEARAHALQAEFERQTQELEQARRVQLSMLPESLPEHPMASVAAAMQTAAEVGGDYYDFSVAPDGSMSFIIGDATGHGVQAGTMVTAMKSLWSAFSEEPDLERLLSRSTEALRRMRLPKLYMAVAVGRLDGQMLELVGAGMPPALVYRAETGHVEQISLKGVPMASPLTAPSRRQCVALAPGDVVVLMSDGFPELFDDAGEMFGYERALRTISDAIPGRSPETLIAHLMEQVAAWRDGKPPNDDVTFIVLQATGVEAEPAAPPGDGAGAEAALRS